jgi:molecular chaperone DnaK (HSP70)
LSRAPDVAPRAALRLPCALGTTAPGAHIRMIVGIDLGTTNSLIGIYGEDGVQLVPNVLGDLLSARRWASSASWARTGR